MKKIIQCILVIVTLFLMVGNTYAAKKTTVYTNKNLGWTINMPADLTKDKNDTKQNEIHFQNNTGSTSIYMKMYSKSKYTLDSWILKEQKDIKDNYSSDFVKVIKVESGKINNIPFKKIYTKLLLNEKWINACSMYLVGKNYRYNISYNIPSADYDNKVKKTSIEAALMTFKFVEPNSKTVGTLIEDNNELDSALHMYAVNKYLSWSAEVPDTWKEGANIEGITSYSDAKGLMTFVVTSTKNASNTSLEALSKVIEANWSKITSMKVTNKSKITNIKGIDMFIYTMKMTGSSGHSYLFESDGNVYIVSLFISNLVNTPKNNKILDNIWNSFELMDSGGIDDFTSVLKGVASDKIGDSYYKWSISNQKKLSITNRSFNGDYTQLSTEDKKCVLQINVYKNEKNVNLDSVESSLLNLYKKDYTIINSEKRKKGNQEYYDLAYKGEKDNFVNEHRVFIFNNMVYQIAMTVSKEDYTNDYISILDTFELNFTNDEKTEDLSDISESGFRTYSDSKLKWTMDVLPEWYLGKADNMDNDISFSLDDNNYIFATMYSIEPGVTLDSWVASEIKRMNKVYNNKLVKVSDSKDIVIDGVKCKQIELSFNINNNIYQDKFIYIVGKKYRYKIGYDIEDKVYTDTNLMPKIEEMLKSFKFSEPDSAKVGKLFDPMSVNNVNSTRKLTNSKYSWSVSIPSVFTATSDNNDADYVSYENDNEGLYFDMEIQKADSTLENYENDAQDYFKKHLTSYKLYSSEIINVKGTDVRKRTYRYSSTDYAYYKINYELVKNGYVYDVYFTVSEIRNTDYSDAIFQSIWDSISFDN